MTQLYGLVDTARDPRLYDWVVASPEHACLFSGDLAPAMERVLPYIVKLEAAAPIWDIWRQVGWGQNWGMICSSAGALTEVRNHFRRFLQVQLPDGEVVQFRFYDPRVWRTFTRTCTSEDLAPWFDGVGEYWVETADGEGALRYSFPAGGPPSVTQHGPPGG